MDPTEKQEDEGPKTQTEMFEEENQDSFLGHLSDSEDQKEEDTEEGE